MENINLYREGASSFELDNFFRNFNTSTKQIGNYWYTAKPLGFSNGGFLTRLKSCYKILNKKAIAVHFKEDE